MLKRRLIPKLQMKALPSSPFAKMVLVTTIQFRESIVVGDPVSQAKIYEAQAADELIFLDLDAGKYQRKTMTNVVEDAAEQIFMPFTVGGGVKTIEDFHCLLSSGADKVSINTAAVENPKLITEASEIYGSQCVVLSIDYRDNGRNGSVWIRDGKIKTDLDPVQWARQGEELGAGEILLTSIDRDGMRSGLDIETIRRVADSVSIPVIASGGCGLAEHFVEGFQEGRADGVSAGTYFCFKDENPMQTRSQIRNAGIPIRLHK
ncbi:MAG TPA: imidazole glycerol phosphate synthase cyclase subunit [Methanothrix soehngenii]|jgi:imidazole glycerol-phosphate synthase subunit HisF|nr:imidazole glycerol phosphate synthase cyclase subunit [Methanothrix soehngenii]